MGLSLTHSTVVDFATSSSMIKTEALSKGATVTLKTGASITAEAGAGPIGGAEVTASVEASASAEVKQDSSETHKNTMS